MVRLAEFAEIPLGNEQVEFMAELSVDYMRTRYPDEEEEMAEPTSRQAAESCLKTAEAITQWLLSMLK